MRILFARGPDRVGRSGDVFRRWVIWCWISAGGSAGVAAAGIATGWLAITGGFRWIAPWRLLRLPVMACGTGGSILLRFPGMWGWLGSVRISHSIVLCL